MTGDDVHLILITGVTILVGLVITAAWRTFMARTAEIARTPTALEELRRTVEEALAQLHLWRVDYESRLTRLERKVLDRHDQSA